MTQTKLPFPIKELCILNINPFEWFKFVTEKNKDVKKIKYD
jgi:hypothetical protein